MKPHWSTWGVINRNDPITELIAKSIKLLPCWKLAMLGNCTTYRGALLPAAVIAAPRKNGSMDLKNDLQPVAIIL